MIAGSRRPQVASPALVFDGAETHLAEFRNRVNFVCPLAPQASVAACEIHFMPDNSEVLAAPPSGDQHEFARLLREVDLFAGLERVTLAKLAAHLEPQFYAAPSVIFRQGDAGDALYVVASGTVGVYATDKTGTAENLVRLLSVGEPFGEMALLSSIPRTATIKVETDCEVLRLNRSAFIELVREQPSVALAIAATLSRRLADMLNRPAGAIPPANAKRKRTPHASGQIADSAKAAETGVSATIGWLRPFVGRVGIAIGAAIIIFALGWVVPPPRGLNLTAWHSLVALPALVLDAILEGALGLLLACAWVLTGSASATDALSGFASPSWVLVVSVLIIGAAIAQTGILYRLSLETITRMRGGFIGEATALACAGQLLGPAVPNATSRVIIIAPMLRELIEAMGYTPKSKGAVGLAMAALIGFGQMAATTLTCGTSLESRSVQARSSRSSRSH